MVKLMKKYSSNKNTSMFDSILKNEQWAQGAPVNTIITAEVKDINYNDKKVMIYTGFKSNSFINFQEFKTNGEDKIPAIGDQIPVMIKGIDPDTGIVLTSFKEVKVKQRMIELETLFQNKESIEGIILYKIKSQHVKSNSYAIDLGYGIIGILSVDSYVDIHLGEKITVEIIRFEFKKFGIILNKKFMNESGSNPEKVINNKENFKEGEVVKIRITEIKDFGIVGEKLNTDGTKDEKVFNSIFVHGSELFWNKRSRTATEIEKTYPIGNEILVKVLRYDNIKNRVVFSARELFSNLFLEFQKYIKNNKVEQLECVVMEKRNDSFIMNIPFFYENDNKETINTFFEGKLYVKDLNWNYNECLKLQREIYINQKINCKILNFDHKHIEEGFFFVPLSIKHLSEDPFQLALKKIKLGQIFLCYFVKYQEMYNGFLVKLELEDNTFIEDVNIIIKYKDLGSLNQVKEGSKSICKIIRFEDNAIYASVKAVENDNKDNLIKEYTANNKTTLGSIMKER